MAGLACSCLVPPAEPRSEDAADRVAPRTVAQPGFAVGRASHVAPVAAVAAPADWPGSAVGPRAVRPEFGRAPAQRLGLGRPVARLVPAAVATAPAGRHSDEPGLRPPGRASRPGRRDRARTAHRLQVRPADRTVDQTGDLVAVVRTALAGPLPAAGSPRPAGFSAGSATEWRGVLSRQAPESAARWDGRRALAGAPGLPDGAAGKGRRRSSRLADTAVAPRSHPEWPAVHRRWPGGRSPRGEWSEGSAVAAERRWVQLWARIRLETYGRRRQSGPRWRAPRGRPDPRPARWRTLALAPARSPAARARRGRRRRRGPRPQPGRCGTD